MGVGMRVFSWAICLWAFSAAGAQAASSLSSCPFPAPAKDYALVYGAPEKFPEPQFRAVEIDLDGSGAKELFLADEQSCGARGCEYAVYSPVAKDCFRRIAAFEGSFELSPTRHFGFADFTVIRKIPDSKKFVAETFGFDPRRGAYLPLPGSRREIAR
jgi:hypothetical protein